MPQFVQDPFTKTYLNLCKKKDALIDTQAVKLNNSNTIFTKSLPIMLQDDSYFLFSSHGYMTRLVVSRHQLIPEIHKTVQHKKAQKLPERKKFTNPITETQKRDSP